MNKLISTCIVLALGMMCGCGSSNPPAPTRTDPSVLTYVERPYDTHNPKLYILDTATYYSTPVSITLPTDAKLVTPSPNGKTVVYEKYNALTTTWELFAISADGNEKKLTGLSDTSGRTYPSFSPDGKVLAYSDNYALYTLNVDGTNKNRVFTDSVQDQSPVFSPNGQTLAFYRYAGTDTSIVTGIYTVPVSGGTPTLVYASDQVWGPPIFNLDGTKILFPEISLGTYATFAISSVNLDGSSHSVLTSSTSAALINPTPFGDKIFYNSLPFNSQLCTINVMNTDGSGNTTLESSTTAQEFLKDIFFAN